MDWPLMIVLIVLITGIVKIVRARYGVVDRKDDQYIGHQRDALIATRRDDGEADRLKSEVRQLKDRIAVLERIVTDGDNNRSVALEREIEALRHKEER